MKCLYSFANDLCKYDARSLNIKNLVGQTNLLCIRAATKSAKVVAQRMY